MCGHCVGITCSYGALADRPGDCRQVGCLHGCHGRATRRRPPWYACPTLPNIAQQCPLTLKAPAKAPAAKAPAKANKRRRGTKEDLASVATCTAERIYGVQKLPLLRMGILRLASALAVLTFRHPSPHNI